MLFYLK